jgi:hypothetical protein
MLFELLTLCISSLGPDHCIDMLRMTLMCNADVSRELATWHCSDLAATLWRAYSG